MPPPRPHCARTVGRHCFPDQFEYTAYTVAFPLLHEIITHQRGSLVAHGFLDTSVTSMGDRQKVVQHAIHCQRGFAQRRIEFPEIGWAIFGGRLAGASGS